MKHADKLAAILRQASADASPEGLDDTRHFVRSLYGALCVEAGLDKAASLAELAHHWDQFETLMRKKAH
jgi:hypothetical protein